MRRLITSYTTYFIVLQLSTLLAGACFGVGVASVWPATGPGIAIATVVLTALAMVLTGFRRKRMENEITPELEKIKAKAKAHLADLEVQMGAWSTLHEVVPDGAIVGRVFIVPSPDATSGSIEVDVKEKCPTGHWHDITDHGPVAAVLSEIVTELRSRAMDEATED